MRAFVMVTISCADAATSRSLERVLAPDNRGAPKDMRLRMRREGSKVGFAITSPSPSSALSTAASLLSDVSLFQEVWLLSAQGGPVNTRKK